MAYSALPEPMLARSGALPTRGDFAYEVKWDGFRAIVSTEGRLRVRSRRGWNMTEHVQFLVHQQAGGGSGTSPRSSYASRSSSRWLERACLGWHTRRHFSRSA